MAIFKLKPSCKDYLWGGRKLIDDFAKDYKGDKLAETWELSCHKDGHCYIANGEYSGRTLKEYIDDNGMEVLGKNCEQFEEFPVLVKFIDAFDDLSIQVHPNDEYSRKYEGQSGKTEIWYIVECDEEAYVYYGLNQKVTKDEIRKHVQEDTLLEVLNKVRVKKGDVFYVEAGTIHAIGKNVLIAEIQQNSNITYRLFDYARTDAKGNRRELNVDKAIDVVITSKSNRDYEFGDHMASCKYFTVDKYDITEENEKSIEVLEKSFISVLVVEGEGILTNIDEITIIKKGDSFFIPANSGRVCLKGEVTVLVTTIPEN